MMNSVQQKNLANRYSFFESMAIIVLLSGFCLAPIIGLLFENGTSPSLEKRRQAALPDLTDFNAKFPEKFESYFRDHFAFRNSLIELYTRINLSIFKQSPLPEKVHLGTEDWLFAVSLPGGDPMSSLCTKPTSENVIDDLEARIKAKAHRLKVYRGTPYLAVLAPNKSTVYSDKTGQRFKKTQPCGPDLLNERLKNTDFYVDLKEALITGKADRELYIKTDTHWNAYGAWIGFIALMKKFQQQVPGLAIPLEEDFNFKESHTLGGGDLQHMIGIKEYFNTTNVEAILKNSDGVTTNVIKGGEGRDKLIYPMPGLKLDFPVSVHENTRALNKKRVLVMHDSFVGAMLEMLKATFQQVILVPNYQGITWAVRSAIQPELIIDERIERDFLKL